MHMLLALTSEERAALRRVADAIGCSLEDAAKAGLRAWLIKGGYLDSAEADNDNDGSESRDKI